MASSTGACSPSAGRDAQPCFKRKLRGPGSPISKRGCAAAAPTTGYEDAAVMNSSLPVALAAAFDSFSLTGQPEWIFSSTELDLQADCIRDGKSAPWADLPPGRYRCLLAHVVASLWGNTHLNRHRNARFLQRASQSAIDKAHPKTNVGGIAVETEDDDSDDDADDDRIAAALDLLYLHLCHCHSAVTPKSTLRRAERCVVERKRNLKTSNSRNKSVLPARTILWLIECNVLVPLLALRRSSNRDVAEAAEDCLDSIIAISALFTPCHDQEQPKLQPFEKETNQAESDNSVHGLLDGATYVWSLLQEVQRRQPDAFNVLFHAVSYVHPKGVAVVDVRLKPTVLRKQRHVSSEPSKPVSTVLRRLFFEPSGLWEQGFAESDMLFALPACPPPSVCDGRTAKNRTSIVPLCQPMPLWSLCGYRKTIVDALFSASRANGTFENETLQPKSSCTNKQADHYLVLGFGGGLMSRAIVEKGGTVECVEIDEQVIRAARYFCPRNQATGEILSTTVHHADALSFCTKAAELASDQGCPREGACFSGIVVDLLSERSLAKCVFKSQLWSDIGKLCSSSEGCVVAANAGHRSHEHTKRLNCLLSDHFNVVNAERVYGTDSIVFIATNPKYMCRRQAQKLM
eukprot:INCI2525.1.p1 GENE.INCI2525.1~~INCI2525.1.p1  ORF type:complete len:631 (-),score=100.37 INCI2525.1:29-1921(-)